MIECEEESKKTAKNTDDAQSTEYNTTMLKKTLTPSEILSNAILFLLAGYETTATTLGWISYNLALNHQVQDKLIEEVDSVLEKHVMSLNINFIFFYVIQDVFFCFEHFLLLIKLCL